MSNDEIAEKAMEHDADRAVIFDRWHGGPSKIKLFQIGQFGLVSIPPTIHVADIGLQREFGVSKAKPALSIVLPASNNSSEVLRITNALSSFFRIHTLPIDEAVKTGSTLMNVSRDKANRIAITFMVEPKHIEVGPRIVISSVKW